MEVFVFLLTIFARWVVLFLKYSFSWHLYKFNIYSLFVWRQSFQALFLTPFTRIILVFLRNLVIILLILEVSKCHAPITTSQDKITQFMQLSSPFSVVLISPTLVKLWNTSSYYYCLFLYFDFEFSAIFDMKFQYFF